MQCKEWDDANSELFKESHDEAVHKNSYKSRLYELISASLNTSRRKMWDTIEAMEGDQPPPAAPPLVPYGTTFPLMSGGTMDAVHRFIYPD